MPMKLTYKFSIISAVYNTAEYLEEMIDSVISQDIGFKENVQLILVDDGSTDGSGEICEQYEKRYPYNILYIKKAHTGVSHTRNQGIAYAQGKLVNFLDADDRLEKNALSEVWSFYKKHREEMNIVAIPIFLFEAEQGQHILNDKFTSSRVIKISEETTAVLLSSSSSFIDKEVLKEHRFDEHLKYAEDAKLLTEILMTTGTYGVVNTTKYWYRKRKRHTSAIQSGYNNKGWYIDYLKGFSMQLLDWNIKEEFKEYIAYLVMYDLQWRINQLEHAKKTLNKEELKVYMRLLKKILRKIDRRYIYAQKYMTLKRKVLAFIVRGKLK
ncbi:glycosyltransferase family 2 protein [Cellulosilyticum ruminicola]|uniref:glycosyltransferase family 2 protein n=1 Tax=Cellulosilyticum ruminicola TaxID=425254 RepID=UPI0006D16DA1|nr:glycosyltransferase family 2 protein [Cellulosilyticum ruminicola]